MNDPLRVLIADDEYWVRENLRTLLDWAAFGLELTEMAVDGEDAVSKMAQYRPDILITDINMPYISGVALMREVRSRWPRTVIIVLSGYSDFEYVREALLVGAMDYLLKPVGKGRLAEVLERAANQIFSEAHAQSEQALFRERLRMAASSLLDRDFSQWLHDAQRRDLPEGDAARMFEYERPFSNYRLVLIRLPELAQRLGKDGIPQSVAEASFRLKGVIDRALTRGNRIVIHDLYHISRFLLISDAGLGGLSDDMRALPAEVRRQFGTYAKIVISSGYFSFSELRRAYDEVNEAMLASACGDADVLTLAENRSREPAVQRLSPDAQRQLEYAVRQQNRERFDALLRQTGVFDCVNRGWSIAELIRCVSDAAWVLRHYACRGVDALQLLTLDNLLDSILDCAERVDIAELRSLFSELEDECFQPDMAPGPSDTMLATVGRVQRYIEAHYADDFSLGQLAERFGVTESYLSRMFKQHVGCNLVLYLARTRIAHAKALLANRDVSITEVAQLVGYEDYSYFSRVFKKMEGMSPRSYREENLR